MKLQSILCLRMSSGLDEIATRWKSWKRWHGSTFLGVGWWGGEVWRSISIHQRFTQSPPEKRWAVFSKPSRVLKILIKLIGLIVLLILIIAISYLDYFDSWSYPRWLLSPASITRCWRRSTALSSTRTIQVWSWTYKLTSYYEAHNIIFEINKQASSF